MTKTVKVLVSFALLAIAGCQFNARSPEQYRDDTQTLIQNNAPAIEQCYTAALQQDKNLAGQVKVTFVVEPETGRVVNPQADPAAPPALGQCVVQVLGSLTLAPPDEREGQATWLFDFQARPTPAVSAAPAEPAPAAQAPGAGPATATATTPK